MNSVQEDGPLGKSLVSKIAQLAKKAVDEALREGHPFEGIEKELLEATGESTRQALKAGLERLTELDGDQVRINGELFKRHSEGVVTYHSLCGPMPIHRALYRKVGEKNGETKVPLELRAGLIHRATPALASYVLNGYAKATSREVHEDLCNSHRRPPSRSTLERLGKTMGNEVSSLEAVIEPVLRQQEFLPDGAFGISVGIDRTTVPMAELRKDWEVIHTRRKERKKPYQRTKPAPVNVHYRMAYVGTFTVVDSEHNSLIVRKYAIPSEGDPEELVARLLADVRRALDENEGLPIGIVQDGAKELWTLMRNGFRTQLPSYEYSACLDFYHALEHLKDALQLTKLKNWLVAFGRLRHELLNNGDAARKLIKYLMRHRAQLRGLKRRELGKEIRYFLRRIGEMNYRAVRKSGLPIGSGSTEGACKSVVMARTKRSGQRWHLCGATAALTLRASYCSGRLSGVWRELQNSHSAHLMSA